MQQGLADMRAHWVTAAAIMLLSACSPSKEFSSGTQELEGAPARDYETASPNTGSERQPDTDGRTELVGACRKMSPGEIAQHAKQQFMKHGEVGEYSFFGRRTDVLCSEPGANSSGECELMPNAIVRVETAGTTYGLKASPAGALLKYGPSGIRCEPFP